MGRNIHRSKKIALNRVSVAFKVATLGVVALAALFSGCSREITGEWQNSPPEVRFVNIPPDGSVFSANPVLNWVGSDIDGRILEYQFIVVLQSDIPGGMAPESYAASIPLAEWTVLHVSLDTTHTSATVKLAADLNDPVNTIVQQFVFLRAKDDDGAFSPIVYRLFGRKNHFPETRIDPFLVKPPYVNASARFQNFGGVPTNWFGDDLLDFEGDQPQLEYEWLLFGPYTVAESTLIMDNFGKSVFLTNQRTYEVGDTLIDTVFDFTMTDTLIDTTIDNNVTPPDTTIDTIRTPAIDTILRLEVDTSNSDLDGFGKFHLVLVLDSIYKLDSVLDSSGMTSRLIEQSFNPLTGESWTTQQSTVFFNLFDNDPLVKSKLTDDTTRVRTFLFWVRSRDDANVPDPTPSFGIFNAIEPRHERDILMVDWEKALRNQSQQGLVIPCIESQKDPLFRAGLDTSKRVMSEYLAGWLDGSVGHDASFIFDTTTFDPCGKDSGLIPPEANCKSALYKPRHASNDYSTHGALPTGSVFGISLRDILKHKVVIFLKENLASNLPVLVSSPAETWIVSGALSGINFWTMSRSSFQQKGFDFEEPYCNDIGTIGLPAIYSVVFGLEQTCNQAWFGMNRRLNIRNEDFIGAIPSGAPGISSAEFPALSINRQRLRNFLRWVDFNECRFEDIAEYPFVHDDSVAALPAVGYVVPNIGVGAKAIYLFKSRFGEGRYPFFNLQTGDGNYNGTVVAVRRDAGFFRVSHWEFTPLTFDTASFQVAFNSMMDWLFETWGGPPTVGGSPVYKRTPRTMFSAGDYSLATLSNWNILRAQEQIDELTPPGRRGVRDQYEAEIYIKRYMERRKLEARSAGF